MKKLKKIIVLVFLLSLSLSPIAQAATYHIDIDAGGVLAGNVYGFQIDYTLSGGGSLSTSDLVVAAAYSPATAWDISDIGNTILGFTMGDDPLLSGHILSFVTPDEFLPTYWELSDPTGSNDAFVFGHDFFANFNRNSNRYIIANHNGMPPVPVPGAVWLLASGLAGMVGLRRKIS